MLGVVLLAVVAVHQRFPYLVVLVSQDLPVVEILLYCRLVSLV